MSKHLNEQGHCPECSSEDIDLNRRYVEVNDMTEVYTCNTCKSIFAECYTLIYKFTESGGIYADTTK